MRQLAGVGIAIAFAYIGQANAQTPALHDHASREAELESLAQNLDGVVKVCSAMAVRGGSSDKSIRRPEQFATDRGMLTFLETVPAELEQARTPAFGPARFGRWLDPHATIYLLAYDNNPVCRALVFNSEFVNDVRPKLFNLIQLDNFWKSTEIDSQVESTTGPLLRSVFLSPPGVNVQPMVSVTANGGSVKAGQTQMTIAVSLVAKGEK